MAWRVVSLGMAEFHADSDPERALEWRDDHPRALLKLAEQRLIEGRLDDADALARRSLLADPLDGRGYRVLATWRDCAGPEAAAGVHGSRITPRPARRARRAWAAQIASRMRTPRRGCGTTIE